MFRNVDATVRKETGFVLCVTLILSLLMQSIFLLLRQWDYTVLLGNLLGAALAVGNFFLLGLTIQKAVTLPEEEARTKMKLSQQLRQIGLLVGCAVGAALPCFDLISLLVPLLFPRIAATIQGMLSKNK